MAGFLNQISIPQQNGAQSGPPPNGFGPGTSPMGAPPQGFAPQGFAPQGPQGASQGFAPQGFGPQQGAPQQQQQQPQVMMGQDGQQYVATPNGYVPLAQWQAQQSQRPQMQAQSFPQGAPQGAPQGFAPQGQQGFAPQGAPQGFAPQGAPQGFAPQGAPQGFAPQGPQGAPVGGFMGQGPAFGQNAPMAQGGHSGAPSGAPVGRSWDQLMSGMGQVDSSGRGPRLEGDGNHLVEILRVKNGFGEQSGMPFFSVGFRVHQSTKYPAGFEAGWTETIQNMKYIDQMKERVKNFCVAALNTMQPGQHNDTNVDERHAMWMAGEQQPMKGVFVYVNTKDKAYGPENEQGEKSKHFTLHYWSPFMQQNQTQAQQR